jgi:hypothetical protein
LPRASSAAPPSSCSGNYSYTFLWLNLQILGFATVVT